MLIYLSGPNTSYSHIYLPNDLLNWRPPYTPGFRSLFQTATSTFWQCAPHSTTAPNRHSSNCFVKFRAWFVPSIIWFTSHLLKRTHLCSSSRPKKVSLHLFLVQHHLQKSEHKCRARKGSNKSRRKHCAWERDMRRKRENFLWCIRFLLLVSI